MTPSKIMIIRHAEKPNSEPGIMPDGAVNPEALTATGWKRANALVGLFDPAGGTSPRLPLAKPTASSLRWRRRMRSGRMSNRSFLQRGAEAADAKQTCERRSTPSCTC